MVIGLAIYEGVAVGAAYLAAVFISNLPESIPSTPGLVAPRCGRSSGSPAVGAQCEQMGRDVTNQLRSAKRLAVSAADRLAPAITRKYRRLRYLEANLTALRPPNQLVPESVASQARPHVGIDLREGAQTKRVSAWETYADLFQVVRSDPTINTWYGGGDRVHNNYYGSPDAEAYVSMIADERPEKIIEVGGGFSTLIARRAIDWLGISCELSVVDPAPRADVSRVADTVMRERVEEVDVGTMTKGGRALLFIDSSHVIRTGGDVPYLYGQVIPELPAGTLLHVHDIYFPYDYPDSVREAFYTEQYVLEALLSHSPRYRIEVANHFLSKQHRELMQRIISPAVGDDPHHYGTALWISVKPVGSAPTGHSGDQGGGRLAQ
jgi:hypothetical protein